MAQHVDVYWKRQPCRRRGSHVADIPTKISRAMRESSLRNRWTTSHRGAYSVERATDPLHRARIDIKSLSYLAHAVGAPWRLHSGTDLRFQIRRYPRPSELLALCPGPTKTSAHPLLNDRSFELSEDTEHLKHGFAARRRGVDTLLIGTWTMALTGNRRQALEVRWRWLSVRISRRHRAVGQTVCNAPSCKFNHTVADACGLPARSFKRDFLPGRRQGLGFAE